MTCGGVGVWSKELLVQARDNFISHILLDHKRQVDARGSLRDECNVDIMDSGKDL